VLSCDPEKVTRIQQIAGEHGIGADVIGETIPERLEINLDDRAAVSSSVSELGNVYERALESALRADSELVAVQ
jgi:selenophosphate synthetase-related protein